MKKKYKSQMPGGKSKCNQNCRLCQDCRDEMKRELKREVICELLPLFSQMMNGNEELLEEQIRKVKDENIVVSDQWEKQEPKNLDDQLDILKSTTDMRKVCKSMKDFQKKSSFIEDVPVINCRLQEICCSSENFNDGKSNFETEMMKKSNINDIEEKHKENFLKARIEKLERENEKNRKEMKDLHNENKELFKKADATNQYGRREIDELINVPVSKTGETTKDVVINFLNNNLDLNIDHRDISTCHRVFTPIGSDWRGGSSLHDPKCPPIYISNL